jgi:hypothetical protein
MLVGDVEGVLVALLGSLDLAKLFLASADLSLALRSDNLRSMAFVDHLRAVAIEIDHRPAARNSSNLRSSSSVQYHFFMGTSASNCFALGGRFGDLTSWRPSPAFPRVCAGHL